MPGTCGRFVGWSGKASLVRGHLSRSKGSEGANHANIRGEEHPSNQCKIPEVGAVVHLRKSKEDFADGTE